MYLSTIYCERLIGMDLKCSSSILCIWFWTASIGFKDVTFQFFFVSFEQMWFINDLYHLNKMKYSWTLQNLLFHLNWYKILLLNMHFFKKSYLNSPKYIKSTHYKVLIRPVDVPNFFVFKEFGISYSIVCLDMAFSGLINDDIHQCQKLMKNILSL